MFENITQDETTSSAKKTHWGLEHQHR